MSPTDSNDGKISKIRKVAIVDDDEDAARSLKLALEDAAFEAIQVAPNSEGSIDELVDRLSRIADAVVCDQRLRYGAFLDISGAELAARLLERNLPVVLVTQYLDQEADVSIRKYRSRLPVVLRRSEADEPQELRNAFARCLSEMQHGRNYDRRPQRTFLRVADVQELGKESVVDAVVHGWHAQDAVRFPLSLIPEELRGKVVKGALLVAAANTQSRDKTALYFENFELAPELDPNDGFA